MPKASKKSSGRSTPIKVDVDKDSQVSVRQIENGFIVSESGSRGKGRGKEWYNKEYFTKTNPVKIAQGGNGAAPARGRMGRSK